MKRILHVIGTMGMGGAETMIMSLYKNIDREQFQFDFMVHTNQEGVYDKEILALGGKIYHVPRFNGINFREYRNAWNSFFEKHSEHRIVHGHIGSSAALYLNIAKQHGRYTIAHSHSAQPSGFSFRRSIWNIYSYPTRYVSDYFFACSRRAGSSRFGKRIVDSEKFSVFNNGINSGRFVFDIKERERIRKELNIPMSAFTIGHVGRMEIPKNHLFLINIFVEVKKKEKDAVLLLVGEGPLREQIEERVASYGLIKSVIMTGIRKDVPALLSAMDVFVFPSICEGLAVVAVEAQAAGLHTVCSEVLPEESRLTNLIEYLPLSYRAEQWAEEVVKYADGYLRQNRSAEIIKKHYDVRQTSQDIQKFYMEHWKE